VQEAMLSMIRHYAGRPEDEWGPLFHSVLASRINDWRRRTRVRNRWRVWFTTSEESGDDPWQNLPDGASPEPAAQAAGRGALAVLEQALAGLPARQRQAFLLRAWDGLDTAQTACAMNCSEGSVKTHYSRALQTLREKLGDHWP
jgi:RNA polymerase sigma-70 factor (ECF subfamily)